MAADGSAHPEIELEQKHFDVAYEHRERRRVDADAADQAEGDPEVGGFRPRDTVRRPTAMESEAVAFGRIDTADDEVFHIGYDLITDDANDPLVINWQAPVASAFYRATTDDPSGLILKRTFDTEGNTILEIRDQWFDGRDDSGAEMWDPILEALRKQRDGRMADIVRTIERAQDDVMRAPMDGLLIVAGGPGTGKTIIGLQRISVLLRNQLEGGNDRMLFVGPGPAFMRYVAGVLPHLGEFDVAQVALSRLATSGVTVHDTENRAVARVKGDARMTELLERAIADRRKTSDEGAAIPVTTGTVGSRRSKSNRSFPRSRTPISRTTLPGRPYASVSSTWRSPRRAANTGGHQICLRR
jgi:DNA helicase IV